MNCEEQQLSSLKPQASRLSEKRRIDPSYYRELFRTMKVREHPPIAHDVCDAKNSITHERTSDYLLVERELGIPWVFVALLHYREAGCNPECQILNGESWDKRTNFAPEGKGPWKSWAHSAVYALRQRGLHKKKRWGIAQILRRLEDWNGHGYAERGLNSPYLWSGTNHGEGVGKFVEDGEYDPEVKDGQVGAALLLQQIIFAGRWTPVARLATKPTDLLIEFDPDGECICLAVCELQKGLNAVLSTDSCESLLGPELLAVDGWAGKKTSGACRRVVGSYLVGDGRGK